MKTRKQKIIRIALAICLFFVIAISVAFTFRNTILQKAITRIENKIARDYDSKLSIKQASFVGLSSVELTEITLVPKDADTLFRIQNIRTSINFWQLLKGDVQLGSLELKNGYIQLVKNEHGSNYDAFLHSKEPLKKNNDRINYAETAYKILTKALNLVPTDMSVENLSLSMDNKGKKASMKLDKLRLVDEQLETSIQVTTNTFTQFWKIKGFADPRHKQADLRFFNIDTGKIRVPYIDERFNIVSGFDSIRLNVSNIDMDGNELHIDGFTSITNLMVNHPKISTKDVEIHKARFDYHFLFGSDFVALDSTSTAQLNAIKLKPFLEYSTRKDTVYEMKVTIPKMKAQDFINSLPKGLFTHFEGMEAEGNFGYTLEFLYNQNKPNALVFDSNLTKENFKITKYGEADLSKLNGSFTYRAIENGRPQRAIEVGPGNPNYTPLSEISPYLRKSVLTTEDPSFFSHRGFINEAFKQSIIKNIRTKKFSRGASTISMQLVKNVFLTREKTLSRKLEEILLVYILENNRLTSKERMLEVYFNIIEWGPNVYGIGEASQFYFQKHPSQLTLNECLFLASIVPRPKAFMWRFDDQGKLKSYADRQQDYLTNLMMRRGILESSDTIYKSQPVIVTGRAKSYIRIKEEATPTIDSLFLDNLFKSVKMP